MNSCALYTLLYWLLLVLILTRKTDALTSAFISGDFLFVTRSPRAPARGTSAFFQRKSVRFCALRALGREECYVNCRLLDTYEKFNKSRRRKYEENNAISIRDKH